MPRAPPGLDERRRPAGRAHRVPAGRRRRPRLRGRQPPARALRGTPAARRLRRRRPLHVGLTDLAVSLGWRPEGTEFEVLPLLVRDPRGRTTLWEIPPDVVQEVDIAHPDYPGIAELGLRWHVNPAISDKTLAIGGLDYRLAPFSGWYVSPEIGARNLGDADRYDKLADVARVMGLDTRQDRTLWKDRAVVELTYAVQ